MDCRVATHFGRGLNMGTLQIRNGGVVRVQGAPPLGEAEDITGFTQLNKLSVETFSATSGVVVFQENSGKTIQGVPFTVTGTSITAGTPVTLDTSIQATTGGKQIDVSAIGTSPNRFIVSYLDDSGTTGTQARIIRASSGEVSGTSLTMTSTAQIYSNLSFLNKYATCIGGNGEAMILYSRGDMGSLHFWDVRNFALSSVDTNSYASIGSQFSSGRRNRFNVGVGGVLDQSGGGGRYSFFTINGGSTSRHGNAKPSGSSISGDNGTTLDFIDSTTAACLYVHSGSGEARLTTINSTDTSPVVAGTPLKIEDLVNLPGSSALPEISLLDTSNDRVVVTWLDGPVPSGTPTGIKYVVCSKDGGDSWSIDSQGNLVVNAPVGPTDDWEKMSTSYLEDGRVVIAYFVGNNVRLQVLTL